MEEIEKKLKDFLSKQTDIEFALIFGSYTTKKNTPLSDIDIAVYLKGAREKLELGERQMEASCT